MYTNILVPYDGSASADKALAAAFGMGIGPDPIDITVLHVTSVDNLDRTQFKVAMRMAGLTEDDCLKLDALRDRGLTAYREQMQERVQEFFAGLPQNIDVKIVVKRGVPREVIPAYAAENSIDCIVMGRRGRGGIRATLGSVSTAVLRNTDLPVLVVK